MNKLFSVNLRELARGAANGSLSDEACVAWLREAYDHPLSLNQTAELTLAMAEFGERLDLTGLPKPWLDKHSTGGVGDKTTIAILPLLAACGLTMVKMSGRGLGITGGTIDKLESVGVRTDLSPIEMVAQAGRIGIALSGQSPNLAPADGRLYALRNQTGLIDSIPLIVSSILSKKIAGGCDTVVLDVKCGSGAFMTDAVRAMELRDALVSTGERCGLRVFAGVTDMTQPLGAAVGNAIEIREARNILRGDIESPNVARFRDFVVMMAEHALAAVGFDPSLAKARLVDGSAAEKAREWFSAQGGDFDADFSVDPATNVVADQDGWIAGIDAHAAGTIALELGAGRKLKSDLVRGSVGLELPFPVGARVSAGDVIGRVMTADSASREWAAGQLREAITLSEGPVAAVPLLISA